MQILKHFNSIIIIQIIFCSYLFSQVNSVWGELEKGYYEVGFKLIEIMDNSCVFSYSSEDKEYKARSLRIHLWYPSNQKSTNCLSVDSYLKICSKGFIIKKYGDSYFVTANTINPEDKNATEMIIKLKDQLKYENQKTFYTCNIFKCKYNSITKTIFSGN